MEMANELQVIVQQEPGTVSWNFVQLKDSLAEMMQTYETMVYTEDSLATAKQDLASLRKLKGVVEDRRKEIRNKCLEPYTVIEGQAKELTSLIDKPIAAIDGQVKAYEAARRKEKKDAIIKHMDKAFADLPGDVAAKLQRKVYDSKWENATTTRKVWVDAINAAHDQTANELKILAEVDEDFRDMAMQAYKINLVLSDALGKVNELQRQREIIRQREQQRKAEQERLEAERKAREAQETAQDLAQAQDVISQAEPETAQTPTPAPKAPDGLTEKVIRIRGNPKQIAKILAYIRFAGATFQKVGV